MRASCGFSGGHKVYPRVCGVDLCTFVLTLAMGGLSPRVRGRLPLNGILFLKKQVYPRVCGVDKLVSRSLCSVTGLSPRVRGRFNRRIQKHDALRFIPACAG